MSSGRSHVSIEPAVRLGFQKENDPSSFGSSNTTSSFSGFSTVPVTVSQNCTRGGVFDHGIQPDMRSLIRQILSEELRSISSYMKRSRSRSSSEDRIRRARRNSPPPSNSSSMSNVDNIAQSSTCENTESGDRGSRAISPVVNKSTDNVSSDVQEPELSLRPDPGEKIGYSDGESDSQEESDNLSQPSSAAQLS